MPARKIDSPDTTPEQVAPHPVPPGPNNIEVRVNDRIVFLQRMHTHTIEQHDDHVTIHAVLKLPVQPESAGEQPNTESVES